MELTVECQKRPEGRKAQALRREGMVPAALYGHNGNESLSLVVDGKTAETLLKKGSLNNTLITLKVPDLSWNGQALLREVQTHPWKDKLYHLSFFAVSAQDVIEVTVPIHLVGEPVGVKQSQGMLDAVLTELQVKCKPGVIPEVIEVEVSQLDVGDAIHIHELNLPPEVEAVGESDQVVVSVLHSAVSGGASGESGSSSDGEASA